MLANALPHIFAIASLAEPTFTCGKEVHGASHTLMDAADFNGYTQAGGWCNLLWAL